VGDYIAPPKFALPGINEPGECRVDQSSGPFQVEARLTCKQQRAAGIR
jgi:hypothetical protein